MLEEMLKDLTEGDVLKLFIPPMLLFIVEEEAMEEREPSGLYRLPGRMTLSSEVCFKPDRLLELSSKVERLASMFEPALIGVLGPE